jgi:hypothetical protein
LNKVVCPVQTFRDDGRTFDTYRNTSWHPTGPDASNRAAEFFDLLRASVAAIALLGLAHAVTTLRRRRRG